MDTKTKINYLNRPQNTTNMNLYNILIPSQNGKMNSVPSVRSTLLLALSCLSLFLIGNNSFAQVGHVHNDDHDKSDIDLHVNPLLENCDFEISSELTQSEWNRATKEVGNILFLNPLSSAKPLGIYNWDLQIELTGSYFDEHSGAWVQTVRWKYHGNTHNQASPIS